MLPIIFVHPNAAQKYQFNNWTTENGLPQNTVNGLLQTPDGYIWFITNDGIVRFDGVRFKVFNKANTESITGNRYVGSLLDKSGNIWFQTESRSLLKYNDGKFLKYNFDTGLPDQSISGPVKDGSGGIIFRTAKEKYFRYQNGEFVPAEIPNAKLENILDAVPADGLWIDGDKIIIRIIGENRQSFSEIQKPETEPIFFHQDRLKNIWWIENFNLYRIINGKKQSFPIRLGGYISFMEDTQGNLWITNNYNLPNSSSLLKISAAQIESEEILDQQITNIAVSEGMPNNNYRSIIQDKENIIWAGSDMGGLIQITPQVVKVFSKDDWGTDSENVYPLIETKAGEVWFGARNQNIINYSQDGEFTVYKDGQTPHFPTALFEDSNRRIWTADYFDGLFYFENGGFIEVEPPANVSFKDISVINEDADGNLWLGAENGLIRYKDGEAKVFTEQDGLPNKTITALTAPKDGKFWIGTRGGISLFENGKFTSFTEQDGLASNYIRSLYIDADKVLWIGTYDGGLSRFKDGKFSTFTTEDGLYSNNVFCTLEDDNGWFWINSNTGIYRVRKQQLNDFADGKVDSLNSIAYTKKDGLLSNEGNGGKQPAGIRRANGEFWFPTARGVAVVKPNEISINQKPPPVMLEEILINNKEIKNYGEVLEIEPGQRNLEIHYTGLSFINSSLVKFRYRMEGLEEKWNNVGTRRVAFYNNLPPGEYSFHVLAANRDGVWNEEGAKIKVVVQPYFYQTWWFFIAVTSAIAAFLLMIYFYRVSNLKKIALARSTFAAKLIESQEAERRRVAMELHDGLGQTLAMIRNRAIYSSEDLHDLKNAEEHLGIITEQTGQAIGEVREIAYNLRPYLLERLGLTKALSSLVTKTAEANKLKLTKQIDEVDNLFPKPAEMSIYRIVQESLSNILKHAEATEITVKVERTVSHLSILIEDNGKGFDTNVPIGDGEKTGGFGIISLSERVRMFGGSYKIESEIGKGTKIIVSIEL